MPCVFYKFQSQLIYDTLRFEGLNISTEYTDDAAVIPNNTSVSVRRIPAAGLKSSNRRFSRSQAQPAGGSSQAQQVGDSSRLSLEQLLKAENLAEAKASEEDKLKAVMYQSSLCYYSSSDAMKLLGLHPPNYICFRCGIPGHHIKNCPSNGDGGSTPHKCVQRIPRSFLVEVEDPDRKGVMVDGSSKYVIPIMNAEAYAVGKKERPPFAVQTRPSPPSSSSTESVSSGRDTRGKRPRSRSPGEVCSELKRSRH